MARPAIAPHAPSANPGARFGGESTARPPAPDRPSFNKPWEEEKQQRQGRADREAAETSAATTASGEPRQFQDIDLDASSAPARPRPSPTLRRQRPAAGKSRFGGDRPAFSHKPAFGGDRPAYGRKPPFRGPPQARPPTVPRTAATAMVEAKPARRVATSHRVKVPTPARPAATSPPVASPPSATESPSTSPPSAHAASTARPTPAPTGPRGAFGDPPSFGDRPRSGDALRPGAPQLYR